MHYPFEPQENRTLNYKDSLRGMLTDELVKLRLHLCKIFTENLACDLDRQSRFGRDVVVPLKPDLAARAQLLIMRVAVVLVGGAAYYLAIFGSQGLKVF